MLSKPTSCEGCPLSCAPHGKSTGFVPTSGLGEVLLMGEAAGADEEIAGVGFIGKSGQYLFGQLQRIGFQRDQFTLANVCACRPAGNLLVGESYEMAAIQHCQPIRQAAIDAYKERCRTGGTHPVILALGKTAFRTLLGLAHNSSALHADYYGYVFWSEIHQIWVIGAPHPAFLVRGQHKYVPVLYFCAKRAHEIAKDGFVYDEPTLHLNPSPAFFSAWVDRYEQALLADPSHTYLSLDIETPKKARNAEDKILREDEDDYVILQCSFTYRTDEAVSIPWDPGYFASITRLLSHANNQLVLWNANYDIPRIRCYMPVEGTICDGMLWWHFLNSSLDKGLGFVTPYYWQTARLWKHLADTEPARYNAIDSLAALINTLGIQKNLAEQGQLDIVNRHVVQLTQVLSYMSGKGLPLDLDLRASTEIEFSKVMKDLHTTIQRTVPSHIRRLKVFKKAPKIIDGLVKVAGTLKTTQCPLCHLEPAPTTHFKSIGKKRLKLGEEENRCFGLRAAKIDTPAMLWAQPLEWKVSNKGLQAYAQSQGHQPIWNRQKGAITFDELALEQLQKRYPTDGLYPTILQHRRYQKLLSSYIGITGPTGRVKGGLRVGPDLRVHPEFTMNPETLRLACQNPNVQQLPRTLRPDDPESIIRNLLMAKEGSLLLELDYAAIEAVLSAYFAKWKDGIRLAKLGVHSYLASHVLERHVDLGWSDGDLAEAFKEIKKSTDPYVQRIYNACKRTIHLSNYGGTPAKMVMVDQETFPDVPYAKRMQDTYFDIAAPIRKWQLQVQKEADLKGFLINPYGYKLNLMHVFQYVNRNGVWDRQPGDDANAALAFLPQSTAAAILKDAILRLYFERFEEAGQFLRFTIHDSLLCEVPEDQLDSVRRIIKEEMTKPVLELPLPIEYDMGSHLVIGIDAKSGKRWGACG